MQNRCQNPDGSAILGTTRLKDIDHDHARPSLIVGVLRWLASGVIQAEQGARAYAVREQTWHRLCHLCGYCFIHYYNQGHSVLFYATMVKPRVVVSLRAPYQRHGC